MNSSLHSNAKQKKACFLMETSLFTHGGDGGDRTHDLLTASQTLSQLSYAPGYTAAGFRLTTKYIIPEHRSPVKPKFAFSQQIPNKRRPFSVVMCSTSAGSMPLTAAMVSAMRWT